LDQERLTNQDMESLGEELLKEKQSLERELHALRAEKDRQVPEHTLSSVRKETKMLPYDTPAVLVPSNQISELESEKQHLSEAVASLQERAQSNSEARVREVEVKNRVLHQSITDTSSRLASLETQLKMVSEEAERLRQRAGRCEEAEMEVSRLERSRDALSREVTNRFTPRFLSSDCRRVCKAFCFLLCLQVASLRACSERAEALERQVTPLEQEVLKLKREVEDGQREQQRLAKQEAENGLLSKENLDLRCSLENLRSSSARLPTLQEELKEAQKETQEVQRRLEQAREEAQAEKKRAERLEATLSSLNQEKHRLEAELERSKEERVEVEGTVQEAQSREEELRREVEELKEERRRREEGDEERKKLQLDLEQSELSRKHLEKESWRMRTLLEAKEAELEERCSKLTAVVKEGAATRKEVERLKEVAVKAKELERENKELQKQATIDKRTLATLREVRGRPPSGSHDLPQQASKSHLYSNSTSFCFRVSI